MYQRISPVIRPVTLDHDLSRAISLFFEAVGQAWPKKAHPPREVIEAEFTTKGATVFRALVRERDGFLSDKSLVGVCSLCPYDFVASRLHPDERESLESALIAQCRPDRAGCQWSPKATMFLGGLAVASPARQVGVATSLVTFALGWAAALDARLVIGHTLPWSSVIGRGSLPAVVNRWGGSVLQVPQPHHYDQACTLEKVWVYWKLF